MSSSYTIDRRWRHWWAGLALSGALIAPASAPAASGPDVRIGWTAWADAEAVSKMTAMVLSKVGLDVELTLADVSAQYRGLAKDDLDLMLMSWQPQTHADYLERHGSELEDLGVLYDDADLGLAVPTYVDDSVRSIGDLAGNAERFGGAIEGIGENAGIMGRTERAMTRYGLNGYELSVSSGPAMAQRLGRAAAEERPIVVTAWRPHWKWAEYELRYLEDPQGVYEGTESIHAMARAGFREDHPKVAAFVERMNFELDELEALMAAARDKGHREAIREWLNDNEARVQRWLQGE